MVDRRAAPAPDALLPRLTRMLRPMVRLLIRSGVTFPALADLLRALYVEVAVHDRLAGEPATDSRVSLVTGVHRKEIRRLRGLPEGQTVPPLVSLHSQLIATWLGAAPYLDAAGAPLALPRSAASGPSFDGLVAALTRDVRPRTVLDDWLAQGIVSLDGQDRVRLDVSAFVPPPGRDEQLFYFARNLHDHMAAACANVVAAGPAPFLDRSVHYDGLDPAAAAQLETAARTAAQAVLLDVNRAALAAAETPAGGATRRVNFGVYLYAEDAAP